LHPNKQKKKAKGKDLLMGNHCSHVCVLTPIFLLPFLPISLNKVRNYKTNQLEHNSNSMTMNKCISLPSDSLISLKHHIYITDMKISNFAIAPGRIWPVSQSASLKRFKSQVEGEAIKY
jgi:hypothetical protein